MTLGKQCQVIRTSDRMTTLCYDVILEVFALCSVSATLLNPVSILLWRAPERSTSRTKSREMASSERVHRRADLYTICLHRRASSFQLCHKPRTHTNQTGPVIPAHEDVLGNVLFTHMRANSYPNSQKACVITIPRLQLLITSARSSTNIPWHNAWALIHLSIMQTLC